MLLLQPVLGSLLIGVVGPGGNIADVHHLLQLSGGLGSGTSQPFTLLSGSMVSIPYPYATRVLDGVAPVAH